MKRLLILLLSLLLLTACSKTSEDVAELHQLVEDETPSSVTLIDQALEEKKIDYETSLRYKAYAAFGDEKLPGEYASGGFNYESNQVFREIQRNWDQLSQATRDELAPFLKRPDDPESYFNLRYGDTPSSDDGALIPAAHAQRVGVYTESLVSNDGRVRIWYPNVNTNVNVYGSKPPRTAVVTRADGEKMAKKIKGYLDDDSIVELFDELMSKTFLKDGTKGGDDKLDVYVAPTGSDLALTFCEGSGPPCSSYILVNNNIGAARENVLKTTFAHELFHAYQYAYKYDDPGDNWWSESTAEWAEDFIYPEANTEQPWLDEFIPYPMTSLTSETDPDNHHYGAYIFPYFLSLNEGDDFMSKSWEGCETQKCVNAVDGVIDGGFKKQWKEFTLWNYNKEPAKFYVDVNGFRDVTSQSSQTGEVSITGSGDEVIDTELMEGLSAYLVKVVNDADTDKVKKLTFKDLKNFTSFSDKTAIKAVIYYSNGQKEIEDWTEKGTRSFCLENRDENFDHIMLIFSNAQIDTLVPPADIHVVPKDNCYNISQEDDRTAVLHFPYSDGGAYKIVDINTTIETNSWGEPEEKAVEGQEYAYLTKWKVKNEFEQIKEAFVMDCQGSTAEFGPGWTTRSAGYVVFDLGPEGLSDDGTFSVDFDYGLPHPHGNYEEVPEFTASCAGVGVGAQNIDLSSLKMYMEDIWQGRIYDMTEDGAKIEIFNSCLYNDCDTQTGESFQTISEPVILEIKKGNE